MYNQFVGVGEETAYGTAVARTHFAKCHVGSALNHKPERKKSSIMSANAGADPESSFDGVHHGEGKIIIPSSYDDRANLKLLKHGMGLLATTGPVSTVYTHTMTRSAAEVFAGGTVPTAVAASVELNYELPDTNKSRLITSALVKSLKVSWQAGEEVKFEYDLIGQKVTQVLSSSSPTFPDYTNYLMKFAQVTVSVDGNAAHEGVIKGFEFTIDNGYEIDGRLGDNFTKRPIRHGVSTISGSFTRKWTTTTTPTAKAIWDDFVANTAKAFIITLTGPAGYSQVWTLSNCQLTDGDMAPEEGQTQEVTFPFEAYYNATNGAVKAVTQNAATV